MPEAPAPGALRRMIDGDPGRRRIARKQRGERRELVTSSMLPASRGSGKLSAIFLHAQHVEVGERPRFRDDPLRVDASVDARGTHWTFQVMSFTRNPFDCRLQDSASGSCRAATGASCRGPRILAGFFDPPVSPA